MADPLHVEVDVWNQIYVSVVLVLQRQTEGSYFTERPHVMWNHKWHGLYIYYIIIIIIYLKN